MTIVHSGPTTVLPLRLPGDAVRRLAAALGLGGLLALAIGLGVLGADAPAGAALGGAVVLAAERASAMAITARPRDPDRPRRARWWHRVGAPGSPGRPPRDGASIAVAVLVVLGLIVVAGVVVYTLGGAL